MYAFIAGRSKQSSSILVDEETTLLAGVQRSHCSTGGSLATDFQHRKTVARIIRLFFLVIS